MDVTRHDTGEGIDGLWERMRAEERADQLSHLVQDAVRDARLAETLAAPAEVAASQGRR